MRKALDAGILVYALLENHPASQICGSLLRSGRYAFYATALTPFEVYFVLRKIYAIEPQEAATKALALFDLPLHFTDITASDAQVALRTCIEHGIDANDGLLLQACLRLNVPSFGSEDRRMLKAGATKGLYPQSPIGPIVRRRMQQWEREKLPNRGPPAGLEGSPFVDCECGRQDG